MTDRANGTANLEKFTTGFFDYFDAKVKLAGRKGNKHLAVKLPEPLHERFGKDKLNLVFDAAQSGKERELVATGSRTFDLMLQHLDDCSALTYQQLPMKYGGGEELMQAVRPLNANVSGLKMAEQTNYLLVFNWRITYRADDKREAIYTVVMDENGQRIHLNELDSTKEGTNNHRSVDIKQLLADAEPIPAEKNEEGEELPVRLPPMTRLTELAESARRFAIYHADLQCVALEAEIQPRLYTALSRLHNYYSQQIEEVYESHDLSGEKRKILETDLERKMAEEVENHRLRVQVDLFSYALVQMPVAVADMTLSDGAQEVTITIRRNRYTGRLQTPKCHSCQKEVTEVAIDKAGHVSCADCLNQCATCKDFHCTTCGINACPVCETSNCESCSQFCWACGERACQQHASQCPTCLDTVCHDCQSECAHCGTLQCHSHLRADAVPLERRLEFYGQEDTTTSATKGTPKGSHDLICSTCAIRCSGCEQYSAHFGTCERSGQRYCLNCLGTCDDCGKVVGPHFYRDNAADKKTYCTDCVQLCSTCQEPISEEQACHRCGVSGCRNCNETCSVCNHAFCAEHTHKIESCSHILCDEHTEECCIGYEPVCPVCAEVCGVCERYFCEEHAAVCELCRVTYCQECVRRGLQLCDTCTSIREDAPSVFMADEPIATHREVAPLVHRYRWQRSGNAQYTIYLGQGPFNSGVLVLMPNIDGDDYDFDEDEDSLVVVRKLSVMDQYWRKY